MIRQFLPLIVIMLIMITALPYEVGILRRGHSVASRKHHTIRNCHKRHKDKWLVLE